jgi:hypothetical protein
MLYILHFMTHLQIVVLMPLPLLPMSPGSAIREYGHGAHARPAVGSRPLPPPSRVAKVQPGSKIRAGVAAAWNFRLHPHTTDNRTPRPKGKLVFV